MPKTIRIVSYPPKLIRKTQVAAYARVSSGKDAMLHSMSVQVSYYSNLIQTHDGWEYVGVYADEAVTGTKDSRDDFQRMLADCRDGKIDLILTKSISRFARNTVTLLKTVRELKALSVDIYFEEQNIHTMSGEGELMMTILASYAQEESRSASENQKWRVRHGFEKGELLNWRFLFGYDISKDKIEINLEQAAVVREVFQRVINGETLSAISYELNKREISRALGGKWCSQRIREMIANEKYLGNALLQKHYRNNHLEKKKTVNHGELPKYFAEGTHEAILDEETFTRANEILQRLEEQTAKRPKPTHSVFTGILRCPLCGKNYKRVDNHGLFGWNCSTYQSQGKSACFGKCIPEETLKTEAAIILDLAEFDDTTFTAQISYIEVQKSNHLLFVFRDGRQVERVWSDRSRAEIWTPEMKEKARQQAIMQRGENQCQR